MPAPRPEWPEVIIHHLEQAKMAMKTAELLGIDIQLRSAPGLAAYAGVGYLQALGEAVGQHILIDCDEDAGLVMAALRAGCRKLVFSGKDGRQQRLRQMAERYGATLHGAGDERATPPLRFSLTPNEDDQTLRDWLKKQARNP